MAEVARRRGFEAGWNAAPTHVRRALLRVLTAMAAAPRPAPIGSDAEITLWVPTPVTLYEHVVWNTGWSLLYALDETGYVLRFLCPQQGRAFKVADSSGHARHVNGPILRVG